MKEALDKNLLTLRTGKVSIKFSHVVCKFERFFVRPGRPSYYSPGRKAWVTIKKASSPERLSITHIFSPPFLGQMQRIVPNIVKNLYHVHTYPRNVGGKIWVIESLKGRYKSHMFFLLKALLSCRPFRTRFFFYCYPGLATWAVI